MRCSIRYDIIDLPDMLYIGDWFVAMKLIRSFFAVLFIASIFSATFLIASFRAATRFISLRFLSRPGGSPVLAYGDEARHRSAGVVAQAIRIICFAFSLISRYTWLCLFHTKLSLVLCDHEASLLFIFHAFNHNLVNGFLKYDSRIFQ